MSEFVGPEWSTRQRVLLALEGSDRPRPQPIWPAEWSREGLADRLGVDSSVVSRHLQRLIDAELIGFELRRVKGMTRRRRAPQLTDAGAAEVRRLRTELLGTEVIIELDSGRLERRNLNALNHLWPEIDVSPTLDLGLWLDDQPTPIPIVSGPGREPTGRPDDHLVHWALEGAVDLADAAQRASVLVQRPLTISPVLRWQLELLASRIQRDGWTPDPLPGRHAELTQFLLHGDWERAPKGWSPTLDAAIRLVEGTAREGDDERLREAVSTGAPRSWLSWLARRRLPAASRRG